MANASRDENDVPSLIAVLDSSGSSIVKVLADPATHILQVSDGTSGSDNGPTFALHDENHVSTILAVSSVDGVTPVPVYADSSGNLLIDSM